MIKNDETMQCGKTFVICNYPFAKGIWFEGYEILFWNLFTIEQKLTLVEFEKRQLNLIPIARSQWCDKTVVEWQKRNLCSMLQCKVYTLEYVLFLQNNLLNYEFLGKNTVIIKFKNFGN